MQQIARKLHNVFSFVRPLYRFHFSFGIACVHITKMVSIKQKDFWIEFIEKYRSFSCLWDVHSKEYSNKLLREEALQVLVEKCKELDVNANKDYVRKRIANMRTAFSREFKKIQTSKSSGCSLDDVYISTLWYYDYLLFLKDGEISREGTSSLSGVEEINFNEDSFSEECFSPPDTPDESSCANNSRTTSSFSSQPKRKLSLVHHQKKFFEKAGEFMSKSEKNGEDEYDILGKRIAAHFRNMESNQRLIAEKIISDILIHGRMNQLTLNSAFFLTPPPPNNVPTQSTSGFPDGTIFVDSNSFLPRVQIQASSYNVADTGLSEFLEVPSNSTQNTINNPQS